MTRPNEFARAVQQQALVRQRYRCASCGTRVAALGMASRPQHRYGEGAHAHHIKPIRLGGSCGLDNCVILCQACHYSAHEGGNYRCGTVIGRADDYPHYHG